MRRTIRAIAALVVATGLVLVATTTASAHSQLLESTPAEGEVLQELPAAYSITMNERLLAEAGVAAFVLRVRDADGLYYGDGCLEIADDTVTTAAVIGPAGDYLLEWQVVSADGHPVGGEIPFAWEGTATAEGTAEPAACGAEPAPPTDPEGHHGETASEIPLADVLWIVGAALAAAIAVTVVLLATRRRGPHRGVE